MILDLFLPYCGIWSDFVYKRFACIWRIIDACDSQLCA